MINRTTAGGALRIHYAKNLSDILAKNPLTRTSTLVGLLTKRKGKVVEQSQGSAYAIPIKSKRTQSSNFSFAKAQANSQAAAKAARFDTFMVPVVYGTGAGYVDGTANAILQGDQNGFVDAMQSETDDAVYGAQNEIALFSYRTGTGSRGRIGAVTSALVTLTNRSDLVNFEVGMDLLAAAADGTGSVRSATVVPITNINWRTGGLSCTVDPTALGWSAAAGGDYLFVDGDFSAGVNTKIQGLGAWCPISEPTVGTEPTFMGVPRYNEPRLCGVRHDMSTSTDLSQAFLDICATQTLLGGGKPFTHFFGNPLDWANYAGQFEGKRDITVENKETGVGFSAIWVTTPDGRKPFLPDRNCPKGLVYGMNDEHLFLVCADDELVKIVDEDGQTITRHPTQDGFEVRVRSLANMACDDPSTLGVIYNVTA
jgi:hypothetical protein